MDDIWREEKPSVGGADASDKVEKIEATVKDLRQNEKDEENDPWLQLVLLMADNEEGSEELLTFKHLLSEVKDINDKSRTGVALIHYTIVYDHAPYIELLHLHSQRLDVNLFDSVVGYSPLMWCFQLNRQNCCTELFSFIDELKFDITNRDGLKPWDLVVPGSSMAEFLDQNNVSQYQKGPPSGEDFVNERSPGLDNLDLQVASVSLENTSTFPASDNSGFNEFSEDFEFDRLIKNQYLEFSDYDIPQILDLLISLPWKNPHITTYPAALLFQCIRYADHKLESAPLVESLVHLSLTRIIATISTDLNPDLETQGDIVVQSYWLSALSFLYYYLCRDESFFKRYPSILQDIINTLHTLMIEITSAIHSRLVPLMDPTLLSYTTIEDVKQTLYKRDWNFFKKRKQARQLASQEKKKSASQFYDHEMLKHLYPPSLADQMKLSPMKTVQVFGALSYVLDLHQIHPLFQQQCLSVAINWFSSTLFNKILKDKKKKCLSRAHAIQIRLNLSSLETWIRNNDLTVPRPMLIDSFMWQRFPFTLIRDLNDIDLSNPPLRNVAHYNPIDSKETVNQTAVISDMTNSLFYYQPFHQITKLHLEPVFQLLQWLQVATTLTNDEALDATLKLLTRLSPVQLLKSIEKYSYEVDEHKFNSSLKKRLSNAIKNQNGKGEPYLAERQSPLLVLPTIAELTDTYTRSANSRSFQPLLPMELQDAVYEIHENNLKMRRNEAFTEEKNAEEYDQNDSDEIADGSEDDGMKEVIHTGDGQTADEYFRELDSPLASVKRPAWAASDEIEANPW